MSGSCPLSTIRPSASTRALAAFCFFLLFLCLLLPRERKRLKNPIVVVGRLVVVLRGGLVKGGSSKGREEVVREREQPSNAREFEPVRNWISRPHVALCRVGRAGHVFAHPPPGQNVTLKLEVYLKSTQVGTARRRTQARSRLRIRVPTSTYQRHM